jgi:hypothetical protein
VDRPQAHEAVRRPDDHEHYHHRQRYLHTQRQQMVQGGPATTTHGSLDPINKKS